MRARFLPATLLLAFALAAPAFAADAPEDSAPAGEAAMSDPLIGYAGTNIELIHPGDKLRIEVYREEELTGSFLVDSSGNINYPFLGEIFVEGLSLDELRAFLTENLGNDYIVNPQIQISFESSPNKSVAILGMVNRPGNYILTSNSTLVRLVSQVGGFLPEASTEDVKVVRTNKEGRKTSMLVNVKGVMSGEEEDFKLEPGDLIYVDRVPEEKKEETEEIVTILGQVNRPGNYALTGELSLIRAVAQAGGFTGVASTHNVRIVRHGEDGRERVRVVNAARILAGASEDVPLEKGDLIVVQESFF